LNGEKYKNNIIEGNRNSVLKTIYCIKGIHFINKYEENSSLSKRTSNDLTEVTHTVSVESELHTVSVESGAWNLVLASQTSGLGFLIVYCGSIIRRGNEL